MSWWLKRFFAEKGGAPVLPLARPNTGSSSNIPPPSSLFLWWAGDQFCMPCSVVTSVFRVRCANSYFFICLGLLSIERLNPDWQKGELCVKIEWLEISNQRGRRITTSSITSTHLAGYYQPTIIMAIHPPRVPLFLPYLWSLFFCSRSSLAIIRWLYKRQQNMSP